MHVVADEQGAALQRKEARAIEKRAAMMRIAAMKIEGKIVGDTEVQPACRTPSLKPQQCFLSCCDLWEGLQHLQDLIAASIYDNYSVGPPIR